MAKETLKRPLERATASLSNHAENLRGAAVKFDEWLERNLDLVVIAVLVAGFLIRYRLATLNSFELDEAYQARLSVPGFPDLWQTGHETTQPPLLVFLLHIGRKVSVSEVWLRMMPMVAGALAPWFIYRWLGVVWSRVAGFCALVILVFSPMLQHLGSVIRPYTMAMLFTSAALYFFECSVRDGSTRRMWWFAGSLWLGVMCVYSTAFFCVMIGVYALLRFGEPGFTRKSKFVWLGAQIVILLQYAYLLVRQILPVRADHQIRVNDGNGYFAGFFPTSTDNPFEFFGRGTLAQFDLAFGDRIVAIVGLVLFIIGIRIVLFARGRETLRTAAIVLVLALPFLLNYIGAYAKSYPYGNARQSAFIIAFIAMGVGVALDWFSARRVSVALLVMGLLVPGWYAKAKYHPISMLPSRDRASFHRMLDHLEKEVPRGGRVLITGDTTVLLLHYLGGDEWHVKRNKRDAELAGRWFYWQGSIWRSSEQVQAGLLSLRGTNELGENETVWVLDTSEGCRLCEALARENIQLPASMKAKRFGNFGLLFQIPAQYSGFPPAQASVAPAEAKP